MNLKAFLPIIIFLISIIYSIYIIKKDKSDNSQIPGILLKNFVKIYITFVSLWAFVGHKFISSDIAKSIGWQSGSPFQLEIAASNLAFAGAAIASSYYDNMVAYKTVSISYIIFLLGTAEVHISDYLKKGNTSINNIRPIITSTLFSLYMIILIFMSK